MRKLIATLLALLAVGCGGTQWTFRVDDISEQSKVIQYRDGAGSFYQKREK